jgi:hypothetical protein
MMTACIAAKRAACREKREEGSVCEGILAGMDGDVSTGRVGGCQETGKRLKGKNYWAIVEPFYFERLLFISLHH